MRYNLLVILIVSLVSRYKECHHNHNIGTGKTKEIFTISNGLTDDTSAVDAHLRSLNMQYSVNGRRYRDFMFDNPVFEAEDKLESGAKFSITDEMADDKHAIEKVLIHNSLNFAPKSVGDNGECCSNEADDNSSVRTKRYETWPSPKAKKKRSQSCLTTSFTNVDDVQQYSNSSNPEVSVSVCRKCSSVSLDKYSQKHGHTFNMKDNRLKSSIRHHAMATIESDVPCRPSTCAVEALSKEDLLVLWKRSEIELQTKLNRMLHQNKHLQQLVEFAEECQKNGEEQEVVLENESDVTPYLISTRL